MLWRAGIFFLVFTSSSTEAFTCPHVSCGSRRGSVTTALSLYLDDELNESATANGASQSGFSRRDALKFSVAAGVTLGSVSDGAFADDGYAPAKRPTSYRVDTTIPPTLIPLNARKEMAILKGLGKGSGTSKDAIFDDSVNLNNILQKIVYGTADAVSSVVSPKVEDTASGPGYASFVCFGVPRDTTSADIGLGVDLLAPMINSRKSDTALGLSIAPLSTQAALDAYAQGGSEQQLLEAMTQAGVPEDTFQLHLPLLQLGKRSSVKFLALAPEVEDVKTVRAQGLQNVDAGRRSQYVLDSAGFIAQTQDPKFRLYTDRSLLKDFVPLDDKDDTPGNFFAERILVHETAATVAATYAAQRPDSFVAIVAPTPDVRFLGGINGRIPRICRFINREANKVTDDAVTTILLNPTAKETLSRTRYIRLEIGTAPETLDYQSKVADYLWFSTMPKVNMIPRLMNA